MSFTNHPKFVVISPCFNEGPVITSFLNKLESVLLTVKESFTIVLVDDCSLDNTLELAQAYKIKADNVSLHVVHLMYNVGHQSAIYQGLLYAKNLNAEYAIIMDSDGEDDPEAIPLLIKNESYDITVVRRGRRKEDIWFRLSYAIYKRLFRFVTGKKMDFGNYSMISQKMIERVVSTSFIHYPAYLLKQKASKTDIVYDRSKRIDGKSSMGMKGLLFHAFRSFIEFAEDLLMLFFKMFIILSIAIVVLFVNVLYQKLIAKTAILGWFSTLSISLIILAVICLGFFVTGLLLLNILHQQNNKTRQPIYSIKKAYDIS